MKFEKPPVPVDGTPEKPNLLDDLTPGEGIDLTGMTVPENVDLGLDNLTSMEDINLRLAQLKGKIDRGEELTQDEKDQFKQMTGDEEKKQ